MREALGDHRGRGVAGAETGQARLAGEIADDGLVLGVDLAGSRVTTRLLRVAETLFSWTFTAKAIGELIAVKG